MADEKQKRIRELSAMLVRIRELCRTLQEEPESARIVAQLREFSDLLDEVEARLRELEK